jgi:hypothetical protein
MLKAEAWPLARDAAIWKADAVDFRCQARRRFVPSMRQKIDLDTLPATCPVTLDELLGDA